MSPSWRSCCTVRIGHVRPLSTLRLLWQTRCGCIDHWCHSVPILPRMQRVMLPVQALHSLAEITILAGGLQGHSGFFRFCLFLRLSVVYVPLCAAQIRVQHFRWQHVAHELWVGMVSWGRVATTSHQRQKANAATPHPKDVRGRSDGDCQRSAKSGRRTQTLWTNIHL